MSDVLDPYHRWLGIPPKDQPPDHYRLLAVERFEPHAEVISEAADRQMAHLRTRQAGKDAALVARLLNEIATARLCLLSPEKRAAYDEQLKARMAAALAAAQEVQRGATQAIPATTSRLPWAIVGGLVAVVAAVALAGVLVFSRGSTDEQARSTDSSTTTVEAEQPVRTARPARSGETSPRTITSHEAGTPHDPAHPEIQQGPETGPPGVTQIEKAPPAVQTDSGSKNIPAVAKTNTPPNPNSTQPGTPDQVAQQQPLNTEPNGITTKKPDSEAHLKSGPDESSLPDKEVALVGEKPLPPDSAKLPAGHEVARYVVGKEPLLRLAIDLKGERVAVCSEEHKITIIDLKKDQIVSSIPAIELNPDVVALTPDGEFVLAGGIPEKTGDAQLRTFRASDGRETAAVICEHGSVTSIAVSPSGTLVATGHYGGVTTLRSTQQGQQRVDLFARGRSSRETAVAFSKDEQHLVFGDAAGELHTALVGTRKATMLQNIEGHSAAIISLSISATGERMLSGAANGSLRVWESWRSRELAKTMWQFSSEERCNGAAALSPDGTKIVTGSDDGRLTIWQIGKELPRAELLRHEGVITGVCFLPSANRIVSCSRDGTVRVWELPADLHSVASSTKTEPQAGDAPLANTATAEQSAGAGVSRTVVPIPADLKAAQQLIEKVYERELKAATQSLTRSNLAQKMLQQAAQPDVVLAERYVLLQQAQQLSILAGNPRLAFIAQENLAKTFEIDSLASHAEVCRLLVGQVRNPPERQALFLGSLEQVSPAIAANQLKVAKSLCESARQVFGEQTPVAMKSRLTLVLQQITLAEKTLSDWQGIEKLPPEEQESPAARLVAGKYLCFNRSEWSQGLEQLALAEQGELSSIAAIDWSEPAESIEQFALAERWLALANDSDAVVRSLARTSANYWYAQALPRLSSLQRIKAQKELEQMPAADLILQRGTRQP